MYTAKQAYKEDCARCPTYHDGTKRKTWEQLGDIERSTWRKNPTPRTYLNFAGRTIQGVGEPIECIPTHGND